jgi:hypothetical protein
MPFETGNRTTASESYVCSSLRAGSYMYSRDAVASRIVQASLTNALSICCRSREVMAALRRQLNARRPSPRTRIW